MARQQVTTQTERYQGCACIGCLVLPVVLFVVFFVLVSATTR